MSKDELLQAHLKEIEHMDAEVFNLGWASGDNFIHSKTSKGRLYSEVNIDDKVEHVWD